MRRLLPICSLAALAAIAPGCGGGDPDQRRVAEADVPRCVGLPATIVGDAAAEPRGELAGTPGRDVIVDTGPDDVRHTMILGGAGRDVICAGPGGDTVKAGAGRDTVHAGGGPDLIAGGAAYDVLGGGPGQDTCATSEPASDRDRVRSCAHRRLR